MIKPAVVVSKCLGFAACRYDGARLQDRFVEGLREHVRFVRVCPECEIGLGVPRKPVRLQEGSGGIRMVQPATGRDLTEEMRRHSASRLAALEEADGFILKAVSPSCGLADVKLFPASGKGPGKRGANGLFTETVLERFPLAAIESEGRLTNLVIREHFLTKLYLRAKMQDLCRRLKMKELVRFHENNKFLLLSYNERRMRSMGRLVANHERQTPETLFGLYAKELGSALSAPPRRSATINALQHIFGFVSDRLGKRERSHFSDLIEEYRQERIPCLSVTALLHSWSLRFDVGYLLDQTLFEPFPPVLLNPTDSGVDRSFR